MTLDKVIWVIVISSQVSPHLLKILNVSRDFSKRILKIEKEIPTVAIASESATRVNGEKSLLMSTSLVSLSKEVLLSLRVMVLKFGLCYSKRLGLRLMDLTIKSKLV